MGELNKEYEASLKSIETENVVDRIFYRPIGFQIARLLRGTGITPNMVTVVSIFVGAAAGLMFYYPDLRHAIYGILFLVCANILDCVDGQLARLTGIKSKIGRILDGFAGDIWFTCIYVAFALRLANEYGSYWFFVPAFASGFSHLTQANLTDYYKTLHLYFISKDKGVEFQSLDQVKAQHKEMTYGVDKFFFFLYRWYTTLQVRMTPILQQLKVPNSCFRMEVLISQLLRIYSVRAMFHLRYYVTICKKRNFPNQMESPHRFLLFVLKI